MRELVSIRDGRPRISGLAILTLILPFIGVFLGAERLLYLVTGQLAIPRSAAPYCVLPAPVIPFGRAWRVARIKRAKGAKPVGVGDPELDG